MIISKTQSSNFIPAPAGRFQAVCVDVVDQGKHPNTFQDGKMEPKISLAFQINSNNEEGNRYLISKWFTLSLHERASLSKFICDWFDINYAQIPDDFDLETLVGQNARIRIVQEPKKNAPTEMTSKITAIEPWEGEAIQPLNYTRVSERDGYTGPQNGVVPAATAPSAPVNSPASPFGQSNSQRAAALRTQEDSALANGVTEAQYGAILAMANKVFGRIAGEELTKLAGKSIADLSKSEASALIDQLRVISVDKRVADTKADPRASNGPTKGQQKAYAKQLAEDTAEAEEDDAYDPFAEPGEPGYRETPQPQLMEVAEPVGANTAHA